MLSFAHSQYLYFLLLIPVFAVIFYAYRLGRKKRLKRFGDLGRVEQLMPSASHYKPWIKFGISMLVLLMVVIVLARPRAGSVTQTSEKVHGIEVIIAMDVSNSMRASCSDDKDDVSRLQKAKMIVEKLIDKLDNDKIGLIVFAGNAYTQMPITGDASSAKLFLDNISTNMAPTQGTAIGAAINLAMNSFSHSKKSQKAIIVVTDCENFEDDASSAAKEAHAKGIQVDVVGVGSTKGMPIPMGNNGEYMTDDNGEVVQTKLNEDVAQSVAKAGRGVYVSGNDMDASQTLIDTLKKLSTSDLATVSYSKHDELFPVFAWIALLLIVVNCIIVERKNSWLAKYNFFTKDKK